MNRITISFPDDVHTKLTEEAAKKNISLGQYVRDLVAIGLRIEEMSSQENGEKNETDILNLHSKILQKGLTTSMETLYLVRYILTMMPEQKAGDHIKTRDTAKEKAQAFVEGFFEKEAI